MKKHTAALVSILFLTSGAHPSSTSNTDNSMPSRSELTDIILPYVAHELRASGFKGLYHYARYVAFAPWIYDKFSAVEEGKFYRSAQLQQNPPFWYRGKTFKYYVTKNNIRLSINLRNDLDNNPAWTAQKQVVTAHNESQPTNQMLLINIPLSSRTLPSPEAIQSILALYSDPLNYPIHVNCIFGSDRTSLASALYVFEHMHQNESYAFRLEKALEQFTFIKYGHIEPSMPNMKKFIRQWAHLRETTSGLEKALAAYAAWYHQQK